MASNGDSRSQMTRNPGDYYVQSVQHMPTRPTSQEVQRSIRMTQPLKPQSIARPNQEGGTRRASCTKTHTTDGKA